MFCHCAGVAGRPWSQAAFSAATAAVHCADGVNLVTVGVVVVEVTAGAHAVRAAPNNVFRFAISPASSPGVSAAVGSAVKAALSALSSAASAWKSALIALISAVHAALGVNSDTAGSC